jgi:signal transduction histidine kinase
MGVPPEDLPHLFERFYRGTNALQSAVTGSGLGLAIAQGIVELHGGRIRAESVLGEGTTMILTLPAAT